MSCLSRPDWPQYFQCVWEELAEPVPLWLPFGVWLLIFAGSGFVISVLYFWFTEWLFGKHAGLKPFDLIAKWYDQVADFLYLLYWRWRDWWGRREAEAEKAGETPAGTVREDPIDSAAADRAPAGRGPEGD